MPDKLQSQFFFFGGGDFFLLKDITIPLKVHSQV